ncbi:MAG: flagellar biosynthetic protein FliQ [Planctomycetota bacterium]
MNPDMVVYIGRRTLETAMLISAPCLIIVLITGLSTAIFQAVTSVRDMTLGMVLKIAGVGVALLLFGGWMLQTLLGFTHEVFTYMQAMTQ